jgi:hypothetical protein
MALVLNAVRSSFSCADITLPCITLSADSKPHQVYAEYRQHAYGERLVWLDNEARIIFPTGEAWIGLTSPNLDWYAEENSIPNVCKKWKAIDRI